MKNSVIGLIKQILEDPKSALRRYRLLEQRASLFDEIFMRQEYYWLVKNSKPGSVVLDIGANIGDTAIYFAMFDNINKVIAYEPVPMAYKLAKNFIEQSPFHSKIILRNMAIGADRETKIISASRMIDFGFDYTHVKDVSGVNVKAITLNDALSDLDNVVIKCDSEGSEATIFNDTDLSMVNAIELEYHGNLEQVLIGLKGKGFRIKIKDPLKKQGILYAIRK